MFMFYAANTLIKFSLSLSCFDNCIIYKKVKLYHVCLKFVVTINEWCAKISEHIIARILAYGLDN
jgi:hypothetical protein